MTVFYILQFTLSYSSFWNHRTSMLIVIWTLHDPSLSKNFKFGEFCFSPGLLHLTDILNTGGIRVGWWQGWCSLETTINFVDSSILLFYTQWFIRNQITTWMFKCSCAKYIFTYTHPFVKNNSIGDRKSVSCLSINETHNVNIYCRRGLCWQNVM